MPHVIVKLASGRSEPTKARIAEAITQAVMANADCKAEAVSVSIVDVEPADWVQDVYKPLILGGWNSLYKTPGYNPL